MDPEGNIYEISESEKDQTIEKIREDTARLEGYLRGRSEEQTLNRAQRRRNKKNKSKKKHGRQ